ncbi:putative solute carrier family 25 member 40 [Rosellinia necatrix]|uniref:Putative solute carrier family 25 member 40 n=1 Tax=Rosellinia necatrix TaxID=77044 RepID=A0A1W2TKG2_ROSNE|nr:putative solute carrier family 25 member 40 [Rosellinia necatrix]
MSGSGASSGRRNNYDRLPAAGDASVGSTMASSPNNHANTDGMDITATQKMASAITGSLLTSLLVTPLDVVRVRIQLQGSSSQPAPAPASVSAAASVGFPKLAVPPSNGFRPSNIEITSCCREVFFMHNNTEICVAGPRLEGLNGGAAECAVEEAQKRNFTSTFDAMRKISRNEGFTTLWRGLSPTLLMAIPANIIYFTGYDWLRFNKKSPISRFSRDDLKAVTAGSTARILAVAAVSPVELFKTRLQASAGSTATGHLKDTVKGIREMVAENGYRSLWRGITLHLWRDVPFSGLYWLGYETVRKGLADMRRERRGRSLSDDLGFQSQERARSQSEENHTAVLVDSLTAGALSGAIASMVTMPFDVGKTRTQVYQDSSKKAAASAGQALAPEEGNMARLLWHIFRTEGVAGLWTGWIPRTLKVAPACAIMISSYEVGKRVFRGINEQRTRNQLEAQDNEPQ